MVKASKLECEKYEIYSMEFALEDNDGHTYHPQLQ